MHTIPVTVFNISVLLLHVQDEVDSVLNKGGADVNAQGEEHDARAISLHIIPGPSRKPA